MLRGHISNRETGGLSAVAARLHRSLRGRTNLVFANTRREVEMYADRLRQACERSKVPNEFFAHHGSLAKAEREDVEDRLKSAEPATAICTSTLEMGINIGQVEEVAQVRCPPSVAALRQRWGRSGRRPGDRSVLRTYVSEEAPHGGTAPQEAIRAELVQAAAMMELVPRHDWCEPPETGGLHLSTLVQQVLSLTAQHGGVYPHQAESVLCSRGPFAIDADDLRAAHRRDARRRPVDELLGRAAAPGEARREGDRGLGVLRGLRVARGVPGGRAGPGDRLDRRRQRPRTGIRSRARGAAVAGDRGARVNVSEVEVVADVAGTAPRFP